MIKKTLLYLMLTVATVLSSLPLLTSCNDKKDTEEEVFSYSASTQATLIRAFGLQADSEVLTNLDSVHFTVDYDRGLIYNADSLPVGTDITGLKVIVEFLNTVSSAKFTITGATEQADTTIQYTTSMTQKLDFTGRTVLTVTSADETQVKDYEVKVLVHKQNPDSLIWDRSWRRSLPGIRASAIAYKAVKQGDLYRVMVYNGLECDILTATVPNQETWDKQRFTLPFTPEVTSLTATDDALYVLADDGTLYTSPDGLEWTSCGVKWHSLLGAYNGRVLGILSGADGCYYHDEYPQTEGYTVTAIEPGFPLSHSSGMIETDNEWTVSQQSILVGGADSEGNLLNNVWGYDGTRWGKINNAHSGALPALADATLFSYYTYKTLPGTRRYAPQETWYLMGGKLADGTLNKTIYLSNTQGVTWIKGDSTIAQPSYMAKFYGAQAFVNYETLTATGGASNMPRRVQSMITTWECPYIYLFGGFDEDGALIRYMWRGVYNRLTNYPVY